MIKYSIRFDFAAFQFFINFFSEGLPEKSSLERLVVLKEGLITCRRGEQDEIKEIRLSIFVKLKLKQ